jgi:pyruvate dehydrogenase E2 component (dihydrolipoamide acetyltransferase)
MPIDIKMPALSPTMEQGTLSKWLVKEGDTVSAGDILAEIETDKATMEFEAVDEGTIVSIAVAEGTEDVPVGTVIATLAEEGEDTSAPAPKAKAAPAPEAKTAPSATTVEPALAATPPVKSAATGPISAGDRVLASPLARRIAEQKGIDLGSVTGTGPNGRIVKADVEGAQGGAATKPATSAVSQAAAPQVTSATDIPDFGIPFEDVKLSNMRKVIARRLTESKQQVPHIYLTVDVRLDALLKLRGELNAALAARDIKLSVNDLLIKALGVALMQVPSCNVSFAGDVMRQYHRADVSVAVSIPGGLITPIITDVSAKGLAQISTEMGELAARAKDGKLQPHEYQGGTASISNMGMMGIKQFDAVINPPQAMILAVGAGEKRPWVLEDGTLGVATVMTVTGSFDHRAIDGADGARLMTAFRSLVEMPLGLVA